MLGKLHIRRMPLQAKAEHTIPTKLKMAQSRRLVHMKRVTALQAI